MHIKRTPLPHTLRVCTHVRGASPLATCALPLPLQECEVFAYGRDWVQLDGADGGGQDAEGADAEGADGQ